MQHLTKFWFLKDFNLFKKMGKSNMMAMFHLLEMIHVKKGDVLHLNRNDKKFVYFLKSGVIKIVSMESDQTLAVLNMGNIFGELAIYEDEDEDENILGIMEKAVVLQDGIVCVIEADQMKMLTEKYGSLKNQLLKLHGLRIRRLKSNLIDLLYKDSETRIKEYVLRYVHEFGQQNEDSVSAKNLLSHKDIAQLTNTSRQTVSNVMSKLRKEGVIDYNSKEINIKLRE